MMNDLVLRLFFHGLIAFVPSDPSVSGASKMTAYVMKDPMHNAMVRFEMNRDSVCPQSAQECHPLDEGACCKEEPLKKGTEVLISWCTCYLGKGVDISFDQQQIGLRHVLKEEPPTVVPTNDSTPDLSWLVHMSKVQGARPVRIDSAKLGDFTRAKISFSWFSERSCHLDQEGGRGCDDLNEKGCDYNLHSFKFVDPMGRPGHRQSLAEYVAFELKFPFPPRLVLKYGDKDKLTLDLGCDDQSCPDVTISNSMKPEIPNPCADGVGCHFPIYYKIAEGSFTKYTPMRQPKEEALPLHLGPRQLFTCFGNPVSREIEAIRKLPKGDATRKLLEEGAGARGVASRIICPMAMFDP